jgi:hypothetical protein
VVLQLLHSNSRSAEKSQEFADPCRATVAADLLEAKKQHFKLHADENGRVICDLIDRPITIDEAHLDHAYPTFGQMVVMFRAAQGYSHRVGRATRLWYLREHGLVAGTRQRLRCAERPSSGSPHLFELSCRRPRSIDRTDSAAAGTIVRIHRPAQHHQRGYDSNVSDNDASGYRQPEGMPNPQLLDFQIEQVPAYLLSLRKPTSAQAGPCRAEIARLELALSQARANRQVVGSASESSAARLHRQPTPQSLGQAAAEAEKTVETALVFARKLEAEGMDAECTAMLKKVQTS